MQWVFCFNGCMIQKEIKSLQHPVVKYLVKLRTDKAARTSAGTVLITGKKLIHELAAKAKFKKIIIEKNYPIDPKIQADEIYVASAEILKKITALQAPEPIAAEIVIPPSQNLAGKKYILGLDTINDPGNLGTLLRTALALGWEGAFVLEGSVDPYNEKALRAAKGATFELPLAFGNVTDLKQLIHKNKLHVYLADMKGKPLEQISKKTALLLLLGSEAHGIRPALKEHFETVSIPISSKMESLNVSIAGAILMYYLKP